MSVEHSVSTGAPKAAQGVAGAGAARKPAGAAEAGGFAALLMSLGADELPVDASLGLQLSRDPAEPSVADSDDAVLLTTEAAQSLSEPLVLPTPPAPLPTEQIRLAPATGDAAAVSAVAGGGRGRGDATAVPADTLPHTATNQAADKASDHGLPAADPAEPAGEVQPLLRQAGWAQRLAQQRSQAAEVARTAQAPRGEDIAARLGWQIAEAQAPAGVAPQALLGAGLGESGLRPFLERQADRHGARAGTGEVGAWGGVAALDGARMDVPAVAPDAGLTTEMRVAEQVSYHVGRGAQSAELEVEGIDERPIHVSIDLQGQEARIEFRAEQAQTRQVLQDAMPHLREMLEREGLTLAGMSVGSSGPQGGQEQPAERGRGGLRQGQVQTVVEGPTSAASARSALPSGRTLDLYV